MRAESVKAGSHSITTMSPSPEATPAPPSAHPLLLHDPRLVTLTGGDSGPALRFGHPVASLLIKPIRHESDDLQIPKATATFDASVVANFEDWIRLRAPTRAIRTPPTAERP